MVNNIISEDLNPTEVYNPLNLPISNLEIEVESKEYDACRFTFNGFNMISRSAKITPKKLGQFVTFWKRSGNGPIEPFEESDDIDFFVVNIRFEEKFGQFVFPKAVLIKRGIISTLKKEGKRAFRVYPSWDVVKSKQAMQSQKLQLEYFREIEGDTDLEQVLQLYQGE
jgi:hypothetical protein